MDLRAKDLGSVSGENQFFKFSWTGAQFPHAQSRARLFGARQSILLITDMIFDHLIIIAAAKAVDIQYVQYA